MWWIWENDKFVCFSWLVTSCLVNCLVVGSRSVLSTISSSMEYGGCYSVYVQSYNYVLYKFRASVERGGGTMMREEWSICVAWCAQILYFLCWTDQLTFCTSQVRPFTLPGVLLSTVWPYPLLWGVLFSNHKNADFFIQVVIRMMDRWWIDDG